MSEWHFGSIARRCFLVVIVAYLIRLLVRHVFLVFFPFVSRNTLGIRRSRLLIRKDQVEKRPSDRGAWGSPVHAAGRIYIADQGGASHVFAAGPKYQHLATNRPPLAKGGRGGVKSL